MGITLQIVNTLQNKFLYLNVLQIAKPRKMCVDVGDAVHLGRDIANGKHRARAAAAPTAATASPAASTSAPASSSQTVVVKPIAQTKIYIYWFLQGYVHKTF